MNKEDMKRVGLMLPGKIEWPELNVLGQPYRKSDNNPRHTVGVGKFVVGIAALPQQFIAEELQRLRDIIAKDQKQKTTKEMPDDAGNAKPSSKS